MARITKTDTMSTSGSVEGSLVPNFGLGRGHEVAGNKFFLKTPSIHRVSAGAMKLPDEVRKLSMLPGRFFKRGAK